MANRKPVVERGSWSVPEFQVRHKLSIPTWRKLVASGRGPKLIHLSGHLTRISYIAEAEWLKAMETPSPEIQAEVDGHAEQLRAARKKGDAHPNNICNRRKTEKTGASNG